MYNEANDFSYRPNLALFHRVQTPDVVQFVTACCDAGAGARTEDDLTKTPDLHSVAPFLLQPELRFFVGDEGRYIGRAVKRL